MWQRLSLCFQSCLFCLQPYQKSVAAVYACHWHYGKSVAAVVMKLSDIMSLNSPGGSTLLSLQCVCIASFTAPNPTCLHVYLRTY